MVGQVPLSSQYGSLGVSTVETGYSGVLRKASKGPSRKDSKARGRLFIEQYIWQQTRQQGIVITWLAFPRVKPRNKLALFLQVLLHHVPSSMHKHQWC